MITVVCHLWHDPHITPPRSYKPEHVNTLANQFRRRLSLPHKFVCVADSAEGFSKNVEVVITPEAALALRRIRSPEGVRFPSCYQRLWNFSEAAQEVLGERIFAVDIDTLISRDISTLLNRPEDFVGWRPMARWGSDGRIGGGMYLLRTGTRTEVYTRFKGASSIQEAKQHGYRGSDQAWMSYVLGRRVPVWPCNSGVYSIRDMKNGKLSLPADACLVHFNGPQKPWNSPLAWVREHYH